MSNIENEDLIEAVGRLGATVSDRLRSKFTRRKVIECEAFSLEDIRTTFQYEKVLEKIRDDLLLRLRASGGIPLRSWTIFHENTAQIQVELEILEPHAEPA